MIWSFLKLFWHKMRELALSGLQLSLHAESLTFLTEMCVKTELLELCRDTRLVAAPGFT